MATDCTPHVPTAPSSGPGEGPDQEADVGGARGPAARGSATAATAATAAAARYGARLSLAGLFVALAFACLSLTPTLNPRAWFYQAAITGFSAVAGYGVGVAATAVGRLLGFRLRPGARSRRTTWRVLAVLVVVLVPTFLVLGARWQDEIRALMDAEPGGPWRPVLQLVVALVYGLSLGSYGTRDAFSGAQDVVTRTQGALWVSTPGFTQIWTTLTEQRDAGSTQVSPVLDAGRTVRWSTGSGSSATVAAPHTRAQRAACGVGVRTSHARTRNHSQLSVPSDAKARIADLLRAPAQEGSSTRSAAVRTQRRVIRTAPCDPRRAGHRRSRRRRSRPARPRRSPRPHGSSPTPGSARPAPPGSPTAARSR